MPVNKIDTKVAAFFKQYPMRSYSKKQVLIHNGDQPQHVFYLEKGTVRQYDISYRGDEVVVNVFKPGSFFPMIWAITDVPNKFFFDAVEDIQVYIAPRSDVVSFLKNNTDVMFNLLSRVYIGVDGLLGRMVQLMSGSARNRLLYELATECRRFGSPQADKSCSITINEDELAARVGLTRETISRELQKAQKSGLLRKQRSQIVVTDLAKLEADLLQAI
ncbi:MAG: Crp/Fnr family transcriptional regulator [Candidatus Saccharibacteria bacterium]|nr:Crp/Fnr family transcriptional regulator [Candidatus Saccharibacteria bacterium]